MGKVDSVGASIRSESIGPTQCDAFGSTRNDAGGNVGVGAPNNRESDCLANDLNPVTGTE